MKRTLKNSYSASRRNQLREDIANEKSLHFIPGFHQKTGKRQREPRQRHPHAEGSLQGVCEISAGLGNREGIRGKRRFRV